MNKELPGITSFLIAWGVLLIVLLNCPRIVDPSFVMKGRTVTCSISIAAFFGLTGHVEELTAAEFALSISYSNPVAVMSWPAEHIGAQLQSSPDLNFFWNEIINTIHTNRVMVSLSD